MAETLSELEPFITGKKFSGVCKKRTMIDTAMLEDFMTMVESDNIAKSFIEDYEVYSDFFDTMVDYRKMFPKDMWQELFYGAKLGGELYKAIPSFCVYMLKKAYESVYQIPNLILKALPSRCIKMFTQQNYFLGGYTLKEVIQNVCNPDYSPLSETNLKNKIRQPNGEYVEIYVCSTDMVAAVPTDIADALQDGGIREMEVTIEGISSRGVPLRTMCGHKGMIRSIYDLRGLL